MISSKLRRSLKYNIFNVNIYTKGRIAVGNDCNVVYRYLKIPIADKMLVPVNFSFDFYKFVVGDYLILPIAHYKISVYKKYKRVMDVIGHIADNSSDQIMKILFNEKEYYGGYGLLLDNNSIPIIMVCDEGEFCGFEEQNTSKGSRPMFRLTAPVIIINSSIFSNTSDNLNKYIISNIIPFITSEKFYTLKESKERNSFLITDNSRFGDDTYVKAEIRIEDTSKYVIKPTTPDVSTTSEDICSSLFDVINDKLVNDITEIPEVEQSKELITAV